MELSFVQSRVPLKSRWIKGMTTYIATSVTDTDDGVVVSYKREDQPSSFKPMPAAEFLGGKFKRLLELDAD